MTGPTTPAAELRTAAGDAVQGARIDLALAALGGEDTEFYLDGCGGPTGIEHAVRLTCRYQGCQWGIFVGEMELWEFVTDAREHWDSEHGVTAGEEQSDA